MWKNLLSYRYSDLTLKSTCSVGRLWSPKDSLGWRDLMLLRNDLVPGQNFFHKAVSCSLGNGLSLLFWHHKWIVNKTLMDKFPSLFLVLEQQIELVGTMGSLVNGRWRWELKWSRQIYIALAGGGATSIGDYSL